MLFNVKGFTVQL